MSEKLEDSQNSFTFTLRRGLGRTLFLSFMLLALVPLLVSGWLSYRNARTSLFEKEIKSLQTAMSLRSLYFEAYFQERFNDLAIQADLSENIFLLKELQQSYNKSKIPLTQFVKSYDYLRIATEHSQDLQDFQERAGYSNIYLIDVNGNILFSVAGEEDLGTNIFTGPYHESDLAKLCRLAVKTGRPLSSDVTIYGPSGKQKTLFNAQLMLDGSGEEAGILVMQIKLETIDALMADASGLGTTGQVFVVGNDGTLRTSLRNDRAKQVLSSHVNNILVKKWLDREEIRHGVGHEKERKSLVSGELKGTLYVGESGNRVLGISQDMDAMGQYDMHWLMIAEIDEAEVLAAASELQNMLIAIVSSTGVLILLLAVFLTRRMITPLVNLTAWAKEVATGDLALRKMTPPANEIGTLYQALSDMVSSLREMIDSKDRQDWFKTGETGLNDEMRSEGTIATLGENILNYLCRYLDLPVGAFFAYENDTLKLTASYAYSIQPGGGTEFSLGEGLVGQTARDKRKMCLQEVPENCVDLQIRSGLCTFSPKAILILPLVRDNKVLGVLEFGSSRTFSEEEINFLEHISESAAIAIQSSTSRQQLQALLKKTQEQAIQLKRQQIILEERNKKIEQSSQYKSEFLANMSHELRTPLNSILLLSSLMADNKGKVLSEGDVECVRTINKAGNDLLNLINQVLDLAKVESGRMEVVFADVRTESVARHMTHLFQPICENKGLEFQVSSDDNMVKSFRSDQFRMEQILKNFLSNSCKFTEKGRVSLRMGSVQGLGPDLLASVPEELRSPGNLAFSVTDTGIGIAKANQDLIFEAFQQADGSTCRHYGGTGLGLSISREIARLLGGCIAMISDPGHGSTFALVIPEQGEASALDEVAGKISAQKGSVSASISEASIKVSEQQPVVLVADDRNHLEDDDKVLLIIDDDPVFATVVRDMAREEQFKVLVAENGEVGLQLTEVYRITAIVLDIGLPGMSGWSVLSRLKEGSSTRHIPVHVISASDRDREALKMGALNFLIKPIDATALHEALAELRDVASSRRKKLLLVEDDATLSQVLKNFLMADDIEFLHADTGAQALAILQENKPDCIILDLGLPDMDGEDLLQVIEERKDRQKVPVIVYTAKDLTPAQKALIDQCSRTTLLKDGASHEQLLAEITLFMHRVEKELPPQQQEIVQRFYNRGEDAFAGKKILLVDDDMRNVFSLRKILTDKSIDVVVGKNGREALEQLQNHADIDLVLMDIMMPVMDGFEAMAEIRKESRFKRLPIIALTAMAMKDDRQKCIDAGASDYLTKPIEMERLFSMLRMWLYGQEGRRTP
ncbi:MAG: response regulator [Proteobacteria bacterium]|nr:response regulator [Pseudomonadota bacterium]MBU1649655.1 response regulator [Pseudomonadota bacterium]